MIDCIKVALQLYSVRDDGQHDMEGTLRKVREMGYEGVEFAGLYGHTPEQIRAWIKEIKLEPVSAHVDINELNKNLQQVIDIYKTIGCPYIAVPWLDVAQRPGTSGFEQTKKELNSIAAECEKQGMTLLYHNHDFEFAKINGEYGFDILFKEIPALQTEIDTCWVKAAGEDPAAYLRRYTNRAPVVHLKDFAFKKQQDISEKIEFHPLGYGIQDIPSLIKAAQDAGTDWVVVEQDDPGSELSQMECARKSMEFLKTL